MKFQVLSSKTLLSSVGPTVAVTVWPVLWAREWAFWLSKGSLIHHREDREAWGSPGCSRFGSHSVWESIRCLLGCPESSGQCSPSAITPSSLKCHTKKLSLILRGEPNQSMLWADHETNKEINSSRDVEEKTLQRFGYVSAGRWTPKVRSVGIARTVPSSALNRRDTEKRQCDQDPRNRPPQETISLGLQYGNQGCRQAAEVLPRTQREGGASIGVFLPPAFYSCSFLFKTTYVHMMDMCGVCVYDEYKVCIYILCVCMFMCISMFICINVCECRCGVRVGYICMCVCRVLWMMCMYCMYVCLFVCA